MTNNKTEILTEELLQYALNENNELVHIKQVDKGLACNCVCPACHERLIAKKGEVRQLHFAHFTKHECKYAVQTSIHMLAKNIIANGCKIGLPDKSVNECSEKHKDLITQKSSEPYLLEPDDVFLEQRTGDIIPDIVVKKGEKVLLVEIYVTHKVDAVKLKKIKELNLPTIEIKFNGLDREITEDELSETIQNGKRTYWVFNPKYEEYKEKQRTKLEINSKRKEKEAKTKERERQQIANQIGPIRKYNAYPSSRYFPNLQVYNPPCKKGSFKDEKGNIIRTDAFCSKEQCYFYMGRKEMKEKPGCFIIFCRRKNENNT